MPAALNSDDISAAGGALANMFPAGTRIAAIGTSICLALGGPSASAPNSTAETINSYVGWSIALSGNRVFLPRGGNVGIGGQGIALIEGRFTTDLTPLRPKIVFVDAGINDPGTLTAAQIKAYWDSIFAKAAAMGIVLIVLPILLSSPIVAGNHQALVADVNAYLLSKASATVRIIDITGYDYTTMTYPENGNFGVAGTKIHPNAFGAMFIGARAALIINSLVAPLLRRPGSSGGPENLIASKRFVLSTGGGAVVSATGVVAAGMTLDAGGAGGATVVGALEPDPDGGFLQKITVSGNYSGNGKKVQFYTGSTAITGMQVGDYVQVLIDMMLDPGAVNIDALSLYGLFQVSGYGFIADGSAFDTNLSNTSGGVVPGAFAITARTKPILLTSVAAWANVFANIVFKETATSIPVSGVARFGTPRVERL